MAKDHEQTTGRRSFLGLLSGLGSTIMTFNFRKGGQWRRPTIKNRQGGQWNNTGAGGGGTLASPSGWVNTEYLLTGEPPTRSNTAFTQNYNGLQDALNSISPDTRLVIDDGSYTGNFEMPDTSHITLDGNGATLTSANIDDALLENSYGNEYSTTTGAATSYSVGQSSIDVNDGSIFSAGDIIRLYNEQDHPDQPFTGSGGDLEQGLFHVVESVSGNTLTLEEDLLLSWESSTRVDRVDWEAEDIRLTNLTLDGDDVSRNGRPGRIVQFRRRKDTWVDNCTVRNGCTGLWYAESFGVRIDNCHLNELGVTASDGTRGYPTDPVNGTHHIYITDTESYNSQRYGFKSGSGGGMWPTRNGRVERCHADTDYQKGFDQHQGSHHWEYLDCTVAGDGFGRDRSDGYYARGGGVDTPNGLVFYARGAYDPRTYIEQQHYVNVGSTNHIYRLLDDGDNQDKTVTFVDVWGETTESLSSFFDFTYDVTSGPTVTLTLENVAQDGTWITSTNYDNHVNCDVGLDITVSHPADQTPAEYFGNEYNWQSGTL